MNADSDGAADAVLHVDNTGTVTLFIGAGFEPHAEATTNATAIRILLEYAGHLNRPVTVSTHYPSGHRTLHWFEPDGTVTTAQTAAAGHDGAASDSTAASPPTGSMAPAPRRGREWSSGSGRRTNRRVPLAEVTALLLVVLVLTGADRASVPSAGPGKHAQVFGSDVLTDRTELVLPYTGVASGEGEPRDRLGSPARATILSTDPHISSAENAPSESTTGRPDERTDEPTDHRDGEPHGRPGDEPGDQHGDDPATQPDDEAGGQPDDEPTNPPGDDPTSPPPDDDPGDDEQDPPGQDTDTEPPARPGGIGITGRSGTSLSVSWNLATDNVGVTAYAVYVDGNRAQTVGSTSTTVNGLTPATSYQISVAALDEAGNMSGSVSVRGTTRDTVPPDTPTGLSGRAGLLSVDLFWDRAVDNVEVVSYAIYVDGERIRTTSSTSTTVNGLLGGVLHTFSVAAIDGAGNLSPRVNVQLKPKLL